MRILALLAPLFHAIGASVTLTWDANPEPDISGYRVYYGTSSQTYTTVIPVGETRLRINDLPYGTAYFFAVTAINTAGLESDYSNEVKWTARPVAPSGLSVTQEQVEWRLRTNKVSPLTITPVAVVRTDPGLTVSGTVYGPSGSIGRTVTASTAGEASLVGKTVTNFPADVSVTLTKIASPLSVQSGLTIQ